MRTVEERTVAPGVYRFGSSRVNWYAVEGGDGLTVVDAGLPDHWGQFRDGIAALGYGLDDVAAVVLTHGHPDHVGVAERLRAAADAPVWVHPSDAERVTTEWGLPPGALLRNAWRPATAAYLLEAFRAGGGSVAPVGSVETFEDGASLDVPAPLS